ncbi:hypothetical protein AB8O64_00405 [Streptomyces sp. QH1-20]|uniref:hypothetical protein n=1 Tax=Streptomyces sp. QH1-20 TaxID=3240934 RepID=UPI003515039D
MVELILTPVVLAATAKAVECLAGILFERTPGEGTTAALRRIFRVGHRSPGTPVSVPDDAEQSTSPGAAAVALRQEDIERLRDVVEATLRDCGTAPESSRLIADAIIGRCRTPRPTS